MGLTLFPALCMQSRLGCRQRLGWLISGVVNKILHLCIQGFTSDTEGKKTSSQGNQNVCLIKKCASPPNLFYVSVLFSVLCTLCPRHECLLRVSIQGKKNLHASSRSVNYSNKLVQMLVSLIVSLNK